ncbi:hypothetical protein BH23CHL4_BH23CHL4_26280 [soil metagenome]
MGYWATHTLRLTLGDGAEWPTIVRTTQATHVSPARLWDTGDSGEYPGEYQHHTS